MGGPGTGKGTQCFNLCIQYPELSTFSNGDLLRTKVKENNIYSKALEMTMAKGEMVDSDYMLKLMEDHMMKS